jgi:adenylosuccinate lyase
MMDHDHYQSPFAWRYGSAAMRHLWSEAHKRRLMRRTWLALAEAEHEAGLVTADQVAQLRCTVDDIDIARASAIEQTTRHDVMAELLTWREQVPTAGGILHLGATSADITDNVDALRLRQSLTLVRARLTAVIGCLAARVEETADQVTLGWTHLQPAAPTTVGYRLAGTLQDCLMDLRALDVAWAEVRGKGFKGAVGSSASYAALLAGTGMTPAELEARAMARLDLPAWPVSTQVYPRKADLLTLNVLAGIAASASTFAFNVRLMQSPPFGEWSEGFAAGQVGSSAMPWKRNPINAENVNSLARYVAALPNIAWQNATLTLLERTLDDSANRRIVLPEAFLATDEILARTERLAADLVVEPGAVAATLDRFGAFAAAERVLLAAAAAGGDRQALHERIRQHSLAAWSAVERGEPNPLALLLSGDTEIQHYVDSAAIRTLMADARAHVGDAPERARALAAAARAQCAAQPGEPPGPLAGVPTAASTSPIGDRGAAT